MDAITLIKQAHAGDKMARDKLILENTGLIWSIVKRFTNRGYEAEDLFQIGSIGLLKAIDKFDLGYDVKFSTYAVPMILGEIKRFLRDDGMLKVSRSIKENQYRIYKMREKLEKNLGREPTVTELAEELGMTPEEIAIIAAARSASTYIPAPAVIPVVIAQNRYKRSIGSFTAVRKRTIESAPTIPSEITTLVLIASVTIQVRTVIPTRVTAKVLE